MTPTGTRKIDEAWIRSLADPAKAGRDDSILAVRAAFAEGKPVDERLGALLAEALHANAGGPQINRMLDLLEGLDALQRVLQVKAELLSHPVAQIRSRAVLLVGRASKNYGWLKRQLSDKDPMVQANAVEAVWGLDNKDARQILDLGLISSHATVVANSHLGFYKIGETASVSNLFAMAKQENEADRVAAYWAMGETLDPRFLVCITEAFRKEGPKTKGVALRALTQLRRQLKSFEDAGSLRVVIRNESVQEDGWHKADLSLLAAHPNDAVAISPTNAVLSTAAGPVGEWTLERAVDADQLAVAFAQTRIINESDPYLCSILKGLSTCLGYKRPRDMWTIDRFVPWKDEPEGAKDTVYCFGELPNEPAVLKHLRENRGFLVDPQIIAQVLPGPGNPDKAAKNLMCAVERCVDALQRVAGSRHLYLFLESAPIPLEAVEYLVLECRTHNIELHGVAPRSAEFWPFIQQLSIETGGAFHFAEDENLDELIFLEYASTFNRYSLRYRLPQGVTGPVDLAIYSHAGVSQAKLTATEAGEAGPAGSSNLAA